jgi:Sensors of blue-light using FAD
MVVIAFMFLAEDGVPMPVSRLIYASEWNAALPVDIAELMGKSRSRNARMGVTGLLIFDGEYFVQAIEGTRSAVTDTYNRIARDPRHHKLHLVSCTDAVRRLFPNWSMGLMNGIPWETRKALLSNFNISCFDPNLVPVGQLLHFFATMAAEAEALERSAMVLALLPPAPAYGLAGRAQSLERQSKRASYPVMNSRHCCASSLIL